VGHAKLPADSGALAQTCRVTSERMFGARLAISRVTMARGSHLTANHKVLFGLGMESGVHQVSEMVRHPRVAGDGAPRRQDTEVTLRAAP
jgi:hypothetical protein